MKHVLLLVFLCWVAFSGAALAAHSDQGNIGFGVELGVPMGLSGKFWIFNRSAIDVVLGWDFQYQRFAFQAGYLYHFPIENVSKGYLAGYVGVGGLLKLSPPSDERPDASIIFSGRLPIGLEYIYKPISFFAEIDPLLDFHPKLYFDFAGGIGFRFYF